MSFRGRGLPRRNSRASRITSTPWLGPDYDLFDEFGEQAADGREGDVSASDTHFDSR